MRIQTYFGSGVAVILALFFIWGIRAHAQGTSSSYRIDESFIGPGGNLESGSTTYKLEPGQQTVGNPGGVGESSSASYTAQSGNTTTADPRLTCTINTSSLNFGALSTSVVSSGTATFSVLNYTAYGYNVTILGNPPTNGAHTLAGMSSTGLSVPGTEQFGMNLRDNGPSVTDPNIGADPVQVPSGSFSFGVAAAGYNTVNSYRYVAGETIASAPKSSGQTDYTASYIVNASTTTPGGSYTGNQTLLCTGTY